MSGKILSICIPVYNKFNFTRSALNDLSKLSNEHELLVFDNGSSDETQSYLKDSKEIVYIRSEENLGFGKACNKLYSMSSAPNVLFLNNDIKVRSEHSTWTERILPFCDRYLVGPTMGQLDNKLNFVREANSVLDGNSYMSGWCIASSKANWDNIYANGKVFDEDFFCYFEDTSMSMMAREKGILFKVVDIPVVHFGKISSKQLNTNLLYRQAQKIFISKWAHLVK